MKILLVHEFYRSSSPSGEDAVFRREEALLSSSGQTIHALTFANDLIGTPQGPSLLKTALSTPWSLQGQKMVRDVMKRFRPDVVHFHNTFPVFSQAALWEARRGGAAVAQTLHNYRWFCANGLLLRNGVVCDACLGKTPWQAICYRCYRGSMVATLPLVCNIALHRWLKTARRAVDQLVVLTPFAQEQLLSLGLPEDLVTCKPHFFEDPYGPEEDPHAWHPSKDRQWIFVGRLKEEKGVQFLPQVWEQLGSEAPLLRIVGDGPLRHVLGAEIRARGLQEILVLEGFLNSSEVQQRLKQSGLLVFPSVCYEGFPLTIGEAFAAGVPVAASRIGASSSLVRHQETGLLFQPGNAHDMTRVLRRFLEEPGLLRAMGQRARKEYELRYTPERNLAMLEHIYRKALERKQKPRSGSRPIRDYTGVRTSSQGSLPCMLFGYPVSSGGLKEDVATALGFLDAQDGLHYVACLNPHSVEQARRDPVFDNALKNAHLLLPDGIGIVLASRILGAPVKEKVAGSDFFLGLSKALEVRGGARYFFLGSTDAVLSKIMARLQREFPAIEICGLYSPPFRKVFSKQDVDQMVKAVNQARPDVLWVGMTAPKQEKWIYENRDRLEVPLAAAVGAVFDFYAGTKPRSKPIWIALGLEWLPRFLREPRRLWERNMKSTPLFLLRVLLEKWH